MILLIDNYDSFTWNLVHYMGEAGAEVVVRRNDVLSADAALAMHLQRVGFDPATGTMAHADALPAEVIHGCGGVTCTPQDATDREATAA